MSADAIARLRALLETPSYVDRPMGVVDLFASDLRALLDAHEAEYARGVAEERARVVAWLRDACAEEELASLIESGEHVKEGT